MRRGVRGERRGQRVGVALSDGCLVRLKEDSPGGTGAGGGPAPSGPSSGAQRDGGLGARGAAASEPRAHPVTPLWVPTRPPGTADTQRDQQSGSGCAHTLIGGCSQVQTAQMKSRTELAEPRFSPPFHPRLKVRPFRSAPASIRPLGGGAFAHWGRVWRVPVPHPYCWD